MSDKEFEVEEQQELHEHHRIVVDKGQELLRIDKFLSNRLSNVSRTRIQAASDAGCILVNDIHIKSNYRVKPGDVITIVLAHPPRVFEIIPEDIPVEFVYEDEHIVIINKPAGMVVHPAVGNYSGTLVNALAFKLKDSPLFTPGEMRPGLVHRIDKDTTGIMVVAKTELALNHLAKQIFDRKVERLYYALVWGNPGKEGTITGNIGRNLKDRKKMAVFADEENGKHAVTHFRTIENFNYVTLVECKLETGRTHQIRVHFEHIRHPLFSDEVYGGNVILKGTTFSKYPVFVESCFKMLPRQALHAKSLRLIHPFTKKEMFFETELPADFAGVLEKWRKYSE